MLAAASTLLLGGVRQLLLVQAEDVMHKLVLLARLDHPASAETHTQKDKMLTVFSITPAEQEHSHCEHVSI